LSVQIGTMNAATVLTSIIAPRLVLEPVATIRISALAMGAAVIGCFFTPSIGFFAVLAGFAVIGGVAGFAINAQLTFLAETGFQQGGVMGLFNTSTYAGLTLLPFTAGVIAQASGFFAAFATMAAITALMAVTIGWCSCRTRSSASGGRP
jgi:hypothetical protein